LCCAPLSWGGPAAPSLAVPMRSPRRNTVAANCRRSLNLAYPIFWRILSKDEAGRIALPPGGGYPIPDDRSRPPTRAFFRRSYDREGMVRLDRVFVAHLAETDVALHDGLMAARRIRRQQILGACQSSAPCSKPPISPACARQAWRRSEQPAGLSRLRPFETLA